MLSFKMWADWANAFVEDWTEGCLPVSAKVNRNQARWMINQLRIREFDPAAATARPILLNMLRQWAADVALTTVHKRLFVLRRFFKFVNNALIDAIPDSLLRILTVPKGAKKPALPTALSADEGVAVMAAAREFATPSFPHMHMYTYLGFGLLMGLRPAELANLDWREVDLSSAPAVLGLKELPTRRLKNNLAAQRLTMPPEIAFLLREYFVVEESGPIFRKLRTTYAFKRVREISGVDKLGAHILRRTAITNWFLQGIDLKLLTILSRHANPVVLYKHYLARPEIADIETGLPFDS